MRVIAAITAVLLLAGCGGSNDEGAPAPTVTTTVTTTVTPAGPDLTGCRKAIAENYDIGWDNTGDPWPPATREAVCSGIDRPTLERLMKEAMDDSMNGTAGPG